MRRVEPRVAGLLAGRPLATALVFVMVGILPLYLTSAQIVSLDAELGFGAARLGIASALHFGLAAAVAHPVGSLVQRIGARTGLRLGASLAALAGVVASVAGAWWVLLVVTSLGGLANAFMQVSTNVVLAADAVYHRQGVSFGAKQGAIPLAGALAGVLLPVVGVVLGWRWTYALAAAAAIVAVVLAPPLLNRNAPPPPTTDDKGRPRLSRSLVWLAVGGACGGAAGNSLSLFVVPSAVDLGITEAAAGAFLAVGSALVFAVRISAGWFADRTRSSGHREMATLLAVGTAACVVLAGTSAVVPYAVAMPLAMMGSWGWPGLVYFTVVRIHPEATARASGVILAGNLTGTLLGPMAVGFLAEHQRFSIAWTICAALSAVSMTAMALSGRAFRLRGGSPDTTDDATYRI